MWFEPFTVEAASNAQYKRIDGYAVNVDVQM
jgi:hypothetical protein